jgi:3-oxoacyl-[acyl-carrier-protein] synthase-3
MIPRPFAEVASVGTAVPERVLTNRDLEQVLDTSDQWIVERTGIRERRIAGPEQTVAMLSRDASLIALERAGVGVEELDAIVLATASPDRLLPSTACDLQALLGAYNAAAFDIAAACPGYLYALTIAEGLIASGQSRTVLVVGAEKLSTITDYQDRSTAILFGDGAGASVVRPASGDGRDPVHFIKSDGRLAPAVPARAARPTPSARRWSASAPTT